jgi:threonine dehydratase
MAASYLAGRPIATNTADTIADGLAVRQPVPKAVARVNALADDVVEVTEESLAGAVRLLLETTGLVVEPAGAAGVAALLEYPDRWVGRRVATPLCGGNLDSERLKALLQR